MAPGMKRWLATILAGFALIALWQLPPDALPTVEPRETTDFERRRAEVSRLAAEVQTTAEALLRYRWSDSLSALIVARAVDGSGIAVPARASLDAQTVAALDGLVRDQVRAVDPMPDAPAFGFVYQPHDHGRSGARPFSRRDRTEVYAGRLDGHAYCIQVHVTEPGRIRASIESRLGAPLLQEPASTVGSCRPYLRHGLPGPAVRAWLEAGGLALADRAGEPVAQDAAWRGRRLPLGVRVFAGSSGTIDVDRCMTGRADGCARLMLTPALAQDWGTRGRLVVQRSPVASVGDISPYRAWMPEHEYYLHDLEAEFGRDAFRRFWTSRAPVDEAFASAFGVPIGAWTVEWLDRSVGLDDSGPALPRSASTGTLLTVALLLAVAYAAQRRRRVA